MFWCWYNRRGKWGYKSKWNDFPKVMELAVSWLEQVSKLWNGVWGREGNSSPLLLSRVIVTQINPCEGLTLFYTWRKNWGKEMVIARQCHPASKWWLQEVSTQASWPQSLWIHTCASSGFEVQIQAVALCDLGEFTPSLFGKWILVECLKQILPHDKHSIK